MGRTWWRQGAVRGAALAWLAVTLVAGACSNPVDESINVLPLAEVSNGDAEPADTAGDGEQVSAGGCDCLTVGTWYRFTELGLSTIDGAEHPVIATLNPLWRSDIEKFELNIVFSVARADADVVEFAAYSGARLLGTSDICIFEDTVVSVIHPRSGCQLLESEYTGINVYAGTPEHPKNCATTIEPKNAIPARRAKLQGRITDTCDGIADGIVLEGVIGEDELKANCTCLTVPGQPAEDCGALDPSYQETGPTFPQPVCVGCNSTYVNLEALMQAFGEVKFSGQLEDGRRGASITGFYKAGRLEASPPFCP